MLQLFLLFLPILWMVSLSTASIPTTKSPLITTKPRKWDTEILKKIQEVYRPLNLPGGDFLGKIGFHHTGVIVTTMNDEDILIHSFPGKAVEVTIMSLAEGPNERSHWQPKTTALEPKPGTSVRDAMQAALKGGGGSYRILHNNCNDVSARVVDALQGETPGWRERRRRKRSQAS